MVGIFIIEPTMAIAEQRTPRQYRYKTLIALDAPLDEELRLMDELAVKYLKTYQAWHHRRLLVQLTRAPVPELEFIAGCLQVDAKNYHTWSYRQWLLAHFNNEALWVNELDFIDGMLGMDVRNNSAWHHRFFVVFQSGVRKGEEDRNEVARRELVWVHSVSFGGTGLTASRYVKMKISVAPNNPSTWNYLRGVLDNSKTPYSTLKAFVEPYCFEAEPTLPDNSEVIVDLEDPLPSPDAQLPCTAAIEFLADIHESLGGDNVRIAIDVRSTFSCKVIWLSSILALEFPCKHSRHVQKEVCRVFLSFLSETNVIPQDIGNTELEKPSPRHDKWCISSKKKLFCLTVYHFNQSTSLREYRDNHRGPRVVTGAYNSRT